MDSRGLSSSRTSWLRALDSAVDDALNHDRVEDAKREDGDDRTEVKAAEAGQQAAEDAQVRFADVAQEAEDRVGGARVGRAQTGSEEELDDDVKDDQEGVDVDERRQVVGDLGAGGEEDHRPVGRPSRTASRASLKAARKPARSRASSPRAVTPPGEATS